MGEFYLIYGGLLGISYLYWAILAFVLALLSFFIKIPPFALPRDPSNWIFKKFILAYFSGAGWLIMSWLCIRMHRLEGEATFSIYFWLAVAIAFFFTFLIVWGMDRIKINRLRYRNISGPK